MDGPTQRQKDDRAPVRIQVECRGTGPFFSAESLNVSRGGVFLQTEYLLPPGRTVQLRFCLPDGPRISTRGRVIWTREPGDPHGPAGMGIQFETLAPEVLRALEDLIQSSQKKNAQAPA
jgi:uncharacterized protein (TIGR02266 family)